MSRSRCAACSRLPLILGMITDQTVQDPTVSAVAPPTALVDDPCRLVPFPYGPGLVLLVPVPFPARPV